MKKETLNIANYLFNVSYLVELIEEERDNTLSLIDGVKMLKSETEDADVSINQALHEKFVDYCIKAKELTAQLHIIESITTLCECHHTFKDEQLKKESIDRILTKLEDQELYPENKKFITTLLTR